MLSKLLISLIKVYKLVLSPMIGLNCRFTPTCSTYAIKAIQVHGAVVGSYLMLKRICRCNPLFNGGEDPVPSKPLKLF